jgi:hypothetical protein
VFSFPKTHIFYKICYTSAVNCGKLHSLPSSQVLSNSCWPLNKKPQEAHNRAEAKCKYPQFDLSINITQVLVFMISGFRYGVNKSSLFWVVFQRTLVVSYRRFGTTYWSHLQGWRLHNTPEEWRPQVFISSGSFNPLKTKRICFV